MFYRETIQIVHDIATLDYEKLEKEGRFSVVSNRHQGKVYTIPGNAIPITNGQNDLTVKRIVKLPCKNRG